MPAKHEHREQQFRSVMTPHIPIRVFLLSGSRFLGEALGRVLRKASDILVVGAGPCSVDAPVEIIESTCDVLLADSVSVLALDSRIPDDQRSSLSRLKVVMIEMDDNAPTFSKLARVGVARYLLKEAAAADVISTIRSVANEKTAYPPRLHLMRRPTEVSTSGHSDS
jgi:DNA-binding NarL/FixJ family response regulator